jgi:elongation factor Tu
MNNPADPARARQPFRLVVEASFAVTGRGTVIAGTIEQGRVRIGDDLELVQLADDNQAQTLPITCIGVEFVDQLSREAGPRALAGILVAELQPDAVRPGSYLRGR